MVSIININDGVREPTTCGYNTNKNLILDVRVSQVERVFVYRSCHLDSYHSKLYQ